MISVILPVYNRVNYIRRCLDSLINQTVSDYEIIVVDDGSTDETKDICDEYQNRYEKIKVIHSENKGASAARNIGLNSAQGDLLMFCDSDDTVEPNWIEKLSACMTNPEVIVSASSYFHRKHQDSSFKKIALKEKECFLDAKDFLFVYRKYQIRTLWHCCFRKTACRFHEDLTLGEDGIFVMEYILEQSVSTHEKMHFIEDYLYNYYTETKGSLTKQKLKSKRNIIEYKKQVYSRFLEKFNYSQEEKEKLNSNLRYDRLQIEFPEAINNKEYHNLKELLLMPEYDRYVKEKFPESRYKRLLERKNIFLIKLYHEIYVPLFKKKKHL